MRWPNGSKPPLDWEKLAELGQNFSQQMTQEFGLGFEAAAGERLRGTADFGANPGGLTMLSYAPENLPAGAPLVVELHGCGQSAAAYDRGAGWSALADRLGLVVLAPEQNRANNPNACFHWFAPSNTRRGHGEVASIRNMVARAIADYGCDPKRVFVTGLSAGGGMASALLAAYPEVFAGGAIIAGLPYGAASTVQEALGVMRQPPELSRRAWGDLVRGASKHRGPWPKVSVWHGDADFTVGVANADAILSQWGDVHGLAPAPTSVQTIDGHPRQVWRNAEGEAVLESYIIAGLGHGTPISPGKGGVVGPFILPAGISSSYRIAEFWGLADGVAEVAAAPAVPRSVEGAQEAIQRAMRAAGLLK